MDKLYKKLHDIKTKECMCGGVIDLFNTETQLPRFRNSKKEGVLYYCEDCGLIYAISINLEDYK